MDQKNVTLTFLSMNVTLLLSGKACARIEVKSDFKEREISCNVNI